MTEIAISKLETGVDYLIVITGIQGDNPDYKGISIGKFLGRTSFINDDDPDDDPDDDGKCQELFVINKYISGKNPKSFIMEKDDVLLNFERPDTFKVRGPNITIDNVTNFTNARKWRPWRSRHLEIPEKIAEQYMKFYILLSSKKKLIKQIVEDKLKVDVETSRGISKLIESHTMRGGIVKKTMKYQKTMKNQKTMKHRKKMRRSKKMKRSKK